LGDVKARLDAAMKTAAFSMIAAGAGVVMLAFLCAALFIWIHGLYGPIVACLVLGGLFFLVLVAAGIALAVIRRRERERAARRARDAANAVWRDPAILAAGLQIGQALGFKRAAPLVILGAFAIGLVLSRSFGSRRRPKADPEADR